MDSERQGDGERSGRRSSGTRELDDEAREIARDVVASDRVALEAQAKQRALDPAAPGDDPADAPAVEPSSAPTHAVRFHGLTRDDLRDLLEQLAEDVARGQLVLHGEEDVVEVAIGDAADVVLSVCREPGRVSLELCWSNATHR